MPATNVEEYLLQVPEGARPALDRLRATLRGLVPDAGERVSYGIPVVLYRGKPLVGYGATATHCAFYLMSTDVMAALASRHGGGARMVYKVAERERILREARRQPDGPTDPKSSSSVISMRRAIRREPGAHPPVAAGARPPKARGSRPRAHRTGPCAGRRARSAPSAGAGLRRAQGSRRPRPRRGGTGRQTGCR